MRIQVNFLFLISGISLGSSSTFEDVLKSLTFVDKTLLIRKIMFRGGMTYITAPTWFGKTTNLNMLRRFLSINVDKNGTEIDRNTTESHELFSNNSLNVYYDAEFFYQHFAQYPVIYIDFKLVGADSYDDFVHSVRNMLTDVFTDHAYLLHSEKLHDEQKEDFKQYFSKSNIKNMPGKMLEDGGRFLTKLLYQHFGRKCIVLIDDYDAPLTKMVMSPFPSDIGRAVAFTSGFTSAMLKTTEFVTSAFMTGTVSLARVCFFHANNIKHIHFSENGEFAGFFGLSQDEINILIKKFRSDEKIVDIIRWYGGYRIERTGNFRIYNTLSVINYLMTKKFENYWGTQGGIPLLENLLVHRPLKERIVALLPGNWTDMKVPDKFSVGCIYKFKEALHAGKNLVLTEQQTDFILQIMTEYGYFTITRRITSVGTVKLFVKIPNREISKELEKEIEAAELFHGGGENTPAEDEFTTLHLPDLET